MITYAASVEDISQIRFAPSPVGEAVLSIRMLGTSQGRTPHQRWIDEVVPTLRRTDFRALRALIPPTGYIPDFLTPPPSAGAIGLDRQLEMIRATDPADLVDEVSWMATDPMTPTKWKTAAAPIHRRMIESPERALGDILDLLRQYWQAAVEPYWQRMEDRLLTDVRGRMQITEKSGIATVFSSLNEKVSWQEDRIAVHTRYDYATDMGGRGLVLVPSVFCRPEVLTMVPPLDPMVIYPMPGAPELWAPARSDAESALGALLGGVRARVLQALRTPHSTAELAALVGVTPGAISQHVGVLRNCGLVTSRRQGRSVVHSLNGLGEDLIRSARPDTRSWPV
ncbi:MAG TPA: DUF5937 family protein [Pseudonocardiaceae bacterium]|jgi:DNA-binding transcriptional ArsR family regulator|nr:DUF5937 family protein [Pseudonocardiaceae bacterium]